MNDQHWGQTISADIVVIGGGTAGIGFVASLLKRDPGLDITVIEPSAQHYYQPAWTLVGGGAYDLKHTVRPMSSVMPRQAQWLQAAVSHIDPQSRLLTLDDGRSVTYQNLIVCPGLRLAWEKIEGLQETLGQHGVTSNYSYQHAALHLATGRRPAWRQGDLYPAGHPDQMRRGTAKSLVPVV